MGLAHRVIPTILCRGRKLVKGKRFDSWRSVGLATQAVRIHQARGVDEIVLLDIGATPEGRGPDLKLVEELAEVLFAPLAVGGGIRTLKDVKALLRAGADKVVIGTAGPDLVKEVADVVGRQAVVAAVDYRRYEDRAASCYTHCGKTDIRVYPVLWAKMMAEAGAGEILLTNIDREGTMDGYDIDTLERVRRAVSVPLVAHGGCSGYEDMARAVQAGANAVAAGSLFQFTDATPRGAAEYLHAHGIEARV